MMFCVLIFALRIVLSGAIRGPVVVTAIVGRRFQLRDPTGHRFAEGINLPDWICNSSNSLEGIPTQSDMGVYALNENTSVQVDEDSSFENCTHRWPTIIVLLSKVRISNIHACQRLVLWRRLENHFPGNQKNLRLEENIPRLMSSISVLAQWESKTLSKSAPTRLAVISQIGCGSISDSLIDNLKYLEKEPNVKNLSNTLSLSIHGWLVADKFDSVIIRKRRQTKNSYLRFSEFSSIFYRHEKQQRQEWNEARIVIEGSGLFDENWTPKVYNKTKTFPQNKYYNHSKTSITEELEENRKEIPRSSMPYIKKPLTNITIFAGNTTLFKIPEQTFYDVEDGPSRHLKFKFYIRSKKTKTDQQILQKSDRWIYLLPNEQIIGLQPLKEQVGQHDVTVCAFDGDLNRICDGLKVFVKKPAPVVKDSHTVATPGVVWKYRLPQNWIDVVKSNDNDSVAVSFQTRSLAKFESNFSILSIITEAFTSKEHKIKILAESQLTGKSLNWLLIVTTSALNPFMDASSPEIVLNICHLGLERVDFEFINLLKEILIKTISDFRNTISSSSRDILLYRIISGREVFLKKSLDSTLIISFTYSPKKPAVNCSEVYISPELLEILKRTLDKEVRKFKLKMISLTNIPGKCKNEERLIENSETLTTSSRFPLPDPDYREFPNLLNKTIKFAVKNGLTFKKMIVFPFEPIIKFIRSMTLLDSNNLPLEESSWVRLSTKQFSIYGLPLSEHVRKNPYKFKLIVALKSGGTEVVQVRIVVEQFAPRFNHQFGMVISISEKDTVELTRRAGRSSSTGRLQTMDQLLVSQTLPYRWQVVDTLASYLLVNQCLVDCGSHFFINSFSEPKTWQINMSWSVVFNSPGFPEFPTQYSVASCSDTKLLSYIRSLLLSDQIPESVFSSVSSIISISQAHPHKDLVKSFQNKHLGTPMWINVESSGSCSGSSVTPDTESTSMIQSSNISVFTGSLFFLTLERRRKSVGKNVETLKGHRILFQNGSSCNLKWIRLSDDGRVIYGLPLLADLIAESYFALRLFLEFLDSRDDLTYFIFISVKSRLNINPNSLSVNMTILLTQIYWEDNDLLDLKIKIVQSINGYLHPSCTLTNKSPKHESGQQLSRVSGKTTVTKFCENAEDIILHAINKRQIGKKTFVDVVWSQLSVFTDSSRSRSGCNIAALEDLGRNLFRNQTSQEINLELISFLENVRIGRPIRVQLRLFGECLNTVVKHNINIPFIRRSSDTSPNRYLETSHSSTKIILGVLCFLTVLVISICVVVYFIRKGLPSSFTRLRDKGSKSVALEDFPSCPKSPLKSPVSTFKKKPKNSQILESIGPSYSNNSPKTPLLSQFSKDDSKFDRHREQVFNEEDATGSYSYAICHPQSPEPEMSGNCSLGLTKQPATSNVIRNPAMMMGSRLNPYRNIPPPIV